MNESQLVGAIKAHIAKADKAAEKAEQHYIAAGQHLKTLKANHAGSWADWETLLKDRVRISTGRASELMQIADGRQTVESVRAGKAESVRLLRARSSLRSEDGEIDGRALARLKGSSSAKDWARHLEQLGMSDDEAVLLMWNAGVAAYSVSPSEIEWLCCGKRVPNTCGCHPTLIVRKAA
jgi:hypothetical protein